MLCARNRAPRSIAQAKHPAPKVPFRPIMLHVPLQTSIRRD